MQKTAKESADYDAENKERHLIKTMLVDKIKINVRVMKHLNLPNK